MSLSGSQKAGAGGVFHSRWQEGRKQPRQVSTAVPGSGSQTPGPTLQPTPLPHLPWGTHALAEQATCPQRGSVRVETQEARSTQRLLCARGWAVNPINLLTLQNGLPGGEGARWSQQEGKAGQCQGPTHQTPGVHQQLAAGSAAQTGGSRDSGSSERGGREKGT